MPMSGPALPCSRANATPVPDVSAQSTPIHRDLTLPLENVKISDNIVSFTMLPLSSITRDDFQ